MWKKSFSSCDYTNIPAFTRKLCHEFVTCSPQYGDPVSKVLVRGCVARYGYYAWKALKQTLIWGEQRQNRPVIRLYYEDGLSALIFSHLLFDQRFRRSNLARSNKPEVNHT